MSSEPALVFGCLPCRWPCRRPGLSDTSVLAQKLARPTRSPSSNSRSQIILLLLLSAFHLGTQPRPPCLPSPKPEKLWTKCSGPPASHGRPLAAVRVDLAAANELFFLSGDQNQIYLIPYT